ncbi:MAG: NADH-quinone oxidoreductase subunit NuoB [Spirochaetia bacterium]|nr:NADH-quinone oxidoreductase subunit NuoB [Spirochaetia bacterium]
MGIEHHLGNSFMATSISQVVGWARKYSLWPLPFATACCSIEFMSVMTSDFDIARFGAERPSFSPRQADLMLVLGTITYKMAPVMWKAYQTMAEPKWVICVGACACTGGMFDTYAVLQGIDRVIPVDMYVPGCPPRPEMILDALVKLQEKISKESINDPKYKDRVEYLNKALNPDRSAIES